MLRNTQPTTSTRAQEPPTLSALSSALFAIRFPLMLALLPFLLFLPLTLVRETFYIHDVQYYFYPYHTISANILRAGELPLWNPYAFSGIPLIGDGQTAIFYPPNWFFFILPGAAALNYAILLQFSIAGVGMYLCARGFGLRRVPASVAALAFMFGGLMTARVVHLSIMSGVALVPLLLLCVDRAISRQPALSPQPSALSPQPSALSPQPSALSP
ncbi:MAG: hypothetical protein H7Z42_21600, partial [Roseiflexaceae bacterium]|nr:hypothetical protein [Roseiflexaceae bacterium]